MVTLGYTLRLYLGNIEIMENKMETTIGFRVKGVDWLAQIHRN